MSLTIGRHTNSTPHKTQCLQLRKTRFIRLTAFGTITLLSPLLLEKLFGLSAVPIRAILLLALSAYCINILLGNWNVDRFRKPTIAIIVVLLLSCRPFIEFIHGHLTMSSVATTLVTSLVVWTLWSIGPNLLWFRVIGLIGMIIAIISIAMALLVPQSAFMVSALGEVEMNEKVLNPVGLLAGPFTNSNTLGVVLATSVPFVFIWTRFRIRAWFLVPILIALWLSSARTSIAVTAVIIFLTLSLFKGKVTSDIHRFFSISVLMAVSAILVMIPMLNWSPSAFTGRAYLWQVNLDVWRLSPWIGHGESWHLNPDILPYNTSYALLANSHNMMLAWLVFGGIIYLASCAALLLLLALVGLRQLRSNKSTIILFVLVLLSIGSLESNWHIIATSPAFFLHGYLIIGLIFSEAGHSEFNAEEGISKNLV